MEPWEREWCYTRTLERAAARQPRCGRCGDVLEEIDDLLYDGVCHLCQSREEDG